MAISSNFELINDNFQTFLHSLDHHFYFYDHQTYDNVVFFFLFLDIWLDRSISR